MKKAVKRTDLLLKFENILSEMLSIFYWNSLLELWMWGVGFFVFFFHPVQMAIIWVFIAHIAKGVIGLVMVFKISPTSYEMIEAISEFPNAENNQHMSFT